jgi:hypothetical protein
MAPLHLQAGLRLGAVGGAVAVAVDLTVYLAARAMPAGDPAFDRQLSAIRPLAAVLPVVVSGPALYVAGRILLG